MTKMIEVNVEGIMTSEGQLLQRLLLTEKNGDRALQIWIGLPEAQDIAHVQWGGTYERPLTSELLRLVIEDLGGKVNRVVISDLKGDTFFARIYIGIEGKRICARDARPSDAVALALRVGARVFVEETVFSKAADQLAQPNTEGVEQPVEERKPVAVEKRFSELVPNCEAEDSAWSDFINKMDLDDFDERRKPR